MSAACLEVARLERLKPSGEDALTEALIHYGSHRSDRTGAERFLKERLSHRLDNTDEFAECRDSPLVRKQSHVRGIVKTSCALKQLS